MKRLLLLLLLAGCAADPAGSCALDRVAELPVRLVGNVPLVAANINGRPGILMLDTGADTTLLGPVAADRFGLRPAGPAMLLQGAGGPARAYPVQLDWLALGNAVSTNVRALVGPVSLPPLDGVLGINVLINYELDLDLPNGRATLYRARPCPAVQPPWTEPYTSLPIRQQPRSGHLFVSGELDGQPLSGILDTGASVTTVSVAAARDTGVTAQALQASPGGRVLAMNTGGVEVRSRTFRSLRIGADVLAAPTLLVANLPPSTGDMLVGGDFLATRRVWFSFLTGRVFVAQPRPR